MTDTRARSNPAREIQRSAVSADGAIAAVAWRIDAFSQDGCRIGGGRCRCTATRAPVRAATARAIGTSPALCT